MGLIDDTPTGKLIRTILLAFAEFERDMIYALELLNNYSYSQVSKMTGISISTIYRATQKIKAKKTYTINLTPPLFF